MERIPELDHISDGDTRRVVNRPLFRVLERRAGELGEHQAVTLLRSLSDALWAAEKSTADIVDIYRIDAFGLVRHGQVRHTHVGRRD